jgi:hypothetical protein
VDTRDWFHGYALIFAGIGGSYGVAFKEATTVFSDEMAPLLADAEHSFAGGVGGMRREFRAADLRAPAVGRSQG